MIGWTATTGPAWSPSVGDKPGGMGWAADRVRARDPGAAVAVQRGANSSSRSASLSAAWIYPLFAHVALAYPSGYVRDRYERLLLQVGYPIVVVIQLATLLVHEAGTRLTYAPLGPDSAILVWRNAELARALEKLFAIVVFGAADRLLRRPRRAQAGSGDTARPPRARPRAARRRGGVADGPSTSPRHVPRHRPRLAEAPVLVAGGRADRTARCVPRRNAQLAPGDGARRRPGPRARPGPRRPISAARSQPRSATRRSRSRYGCRIAGPADVDGRPIELPADGPRRAVTRIAHEGAADRRVGSHDSSLRDDPELIDSAAAAAPGWRSRTRGSRRRSSRSSRRWRSRERASSRLATSSAGASSATSTTARGERLVALALELRAAQRRLGDDLQPGVDDVLADAVAELQLAVGELRELARGVHPAILTEEGLSAALESLARPDADQGHARRRPDWPTSAGDRGSGVLRRLRGAGEHREARGRDVGHDQRRVEGTARSSSRCRTTVSAAPTSRLEQGCEASPTASRHTAGSLQVESAPGHGTRVIGELPCAL